MFQLAALNVDDDQDCVYNDEYDDTYDSHEVDVDNANDDDEKSQDEALNPVSFSINVSFVIYINIGHFLVLFLEFSLIFA